MINSYSQHCISCTKTCLHFCAAKACIYITKHFHLNKRLSNKNIQLVFLIKLAKISIIYFKQQQNYFLWIEISTFNGDLFNVRMLYQQIQLYRFV